MTDGVQVVGVLPGTVLRLRSGCGAQKSYGGMWHFRRAGKQGGLTGCGIVIDMSGPGYAVWEEADLDVGMWGRVCAGCRGSLVGLREAGLRTEKEGAVQLGLFEASTSSADGQVSNLSVRNLRRSAQAEKDGRGHALLHPLGWTKIRR